MSQILCVFFSILVGLIEILTPLVLIGLLVLGGNKIASWFEKPEPEWGTPEYKAWSLKRKLKRERWTRFWDGVQTVVFTIMSIFLGIILLTGLFSLGEPVCKLVFHH